MDKIIIACSCDNNYIPHCGALITSIFVNNKKHDVEINIFTEGISVDNQHKLQRLSNEYNQKINIVSVDSSKFSVFNSLKTKIKLPIQTYFRLIIPSLLSDYEKVLYLDVDMIVCSDLSELWHTNIEGKAIASAPDTARNISPSCKRLGYSESESYYNAGVGLYNLNYLRNSCLWEKAIEIVSKYPERIMYHDQDLLNMIYHGHFVELSIKWNFMQSFYMKEPSVVNRQLCDLEKYIHKPCIIHYTASLKPWFIECNHPLKNEYWKYLKLSPWHYRNPEHFYNNIITFIAYLKIRLLDLKFIILGDKSRIIRKNI